MGQDASSPFGSDNEDIGNDIDDELLYDLEAKALARDEIYDGRSHYDSVLDQLIDENRDIANKDLPQNIKFMKEDGTFIIGVAYSLLKDTTKLWEILNLEDENSDIPDDEIVEIFIPDHLPADEFKAVIENIAYGESIAAIRLDSVFQSAMYIGYNLLPSDLIMSSCVSWEGNKFTRDEIVGGKEILTNLLIAFEPPYELRCNTDISEHEKLRYNPCGMKLFLHLCKTVSVLELYMIFDDLAVEALRKYTVIQPLIKQLIDKMNLSEHLLDLMSLTKTFDDRFYEQMMLLLLKLHKRNETSRIAIVERVIKAKDINLICLHGDIILTISGDVEPIILGDEIHILSGEERIPETDVKHILLVRLGGGYVSMSTKPISPGKYKYSELIEETTAQNYVFARPL